VTPEATDSGAVDLRIRPYATGSIAIGAPATTFALAEAQNGLFTFSADAGELVSVAITSVTGACAVQFLKPDGSSLTSSYTVSGPVGFRLNPLPSSGAYTIAVRSTTTPALAISMLLSYPLTGTIVPDGVTTTRFDSRPAQFGVYTFEGAAGSWQGATLAWCSPERRSVGTHAR